MPAGAYPGQKEAVNSVGSWSYILARADLPDDVAYRLAKALHNGHPALVKRLDQAKETTPQSTLNAAPSARADSSGRAEVPARSRGDEVDSPLSFRRPAEGRNPESQGCILGRCSALDSGSTRYARAPGMTAANAQPFLNVRAT